MWASPVQVRSHLHQIFACVNTWCMSETVLSYGILLMLTKLHPKPSTIALLSSGLGKACQPTCWCGPAESRSNLTCTKFLPVNTWCASETVLSRGILLVWTRSKTSKEMQNEVEPLFKGHSHDQEKWAGKWGRKRGGGHFHWNMKRKVSKRTKTKTVVLNRRLISHQGFHCKVKPSEKQALGQKKRDKLKQDKHQSHELTSYCIHWLH